MAPWNGPNKCVNFQESHVTLSQHLQRYRALRCCFAVNEAFRWNNSAHQRLRAAPPPAAAAAAAIVASGDDATAAFVT